MKSYIFIIFTAAAAVLAAPAPIPPKDILASRPSPPRGKICPIVCPDKTVIYEQCGVQYIRDPCSDHQLPTPTASRKPFPTPTLIFKPIDPNAEWPSKEDSTNRPKEEFLCRRWCENGSTLDEECDVGWFQDPCQAHDAGKTVRGPEAL